MKKKLERIAEHKNLLLFAGGAIAAIAGKKILKSKETKDFCVKTVAKAMKLQDDAEETFQNFKESAEDIRHDAKEESKKEVFYEKID